MRRPAQSIVAFLCVLAHGTFEVSSALGLFYCVAQDHAGIELPSDDCCVGHVLPEETGGAALEAGCCSDTPLYSAGREVLSGPRSHVGPVPLLLLLPAFLPPTGRTADRPLAASESSSSTSLGLRSVILRV